MAVELYNNGMQKRCQPGDGKVVPSKDTPKNIDIALIYTKMQRPIPLQASQPKL